MEISYWVKWLGGIASSVIIAALLGGFVTLRGLEKQQVLLERDFEHQKEVTSIVLGEIRTINTNLQKVVDGDRERVLQIEIRLEELRKQVASGFSSIETQLQGR